MLFGRAKRLWILTVIVHQANKGRERGKDKDIDVEDGGIQEELFLGLLEEMDLEVE